MARVENMPWEQLLLGILEESGGQADLEQIYASIEAEYHEIAKDSEYIIAPRLLEIDPKWGNRPIYQHTVRGCLSAFKKRGLVERVARATYRLTDAGAKSLKEW